MISIIAYRQSFVESLRRPFLRNQLNYKIRIFSKRSLAYLQMVTVRVSFSVSAIGYCLSSPCIHGNCTDKDNGYSCVCFKGWIGQRCDIGMDKALKRQLVKTDKLRCTSRILKDVSLPQSFTFLCKGIETVLQRFIA